MRIFTPQNEYVMRKLLYLVIGLLFVFALPSGAQPECVFTHYSSEEGLSQNTVMSILQDRKGNMWFATWDGINKFDGYDFRTYKAKFDNRINLTNNRVDYMYEDRYGFLWLLTYDNQAWRFNPRTEVFERVPAMKEEGSRFVVTSIKVLPCGSVWLLSEGEGAIRIKTDPESFRLSSEMYSADNGLFPAARVYDVYEDASGNEWMLTDNGIGIIGIGNGCLFLINVNLSRIRMIQPEKDIHQGAFAGSVLPQETVDLLVLYGKVNAVVGPYRPKTFYNANHFDCVHTCLLSLSSVQMVPLSPLRLLSVSVPPAVPACRP